LDSPSFETAAAVPASSATADREMNTARRPRSSAVVIVLVMSLPYAAAAGFALALGSPTPNRRF
jgi:hypothetical protein